MAVSGTIKMRWRPGWQAGPFTNYPMTVSFTQVLPACLRGSAVVAQKKSPFVWKGLKLAEREGFEPPLRSPPNLISSQVKSDKI